MSAHEVRRLGEQLELRVADDAAPHLELQPGDDRHQVGVAAAFAVAVDRALDVGGAGGDGHQAVGDGAARCRCGRVLPTEAAAATTAATARTTSSTNGGSEAPLVSQRQTTAGSGLGGGARARDRIGGVVAVGVEEVLGVVDDRLALADEEAHRVVDHAQVLVAADVQHLAQVQRPRSCPRCTRSACRCRRARAGPGRRPALVPLRRVMPKATSAALRSRSPRMRSKKAASFGFDAGKAALDVVHAELVELQGDAHLLVDRDATCPPAACRRAASCRRAGRPGASRR